MGNVQLPLNTKRDHRQNPEENSPNDPGLPEASEAKERACCRVSASLAKALFVNFFQLPSWGRGLLGFMSVNSTLITNLAILKGGGEYRLDANKTYPSMGTGISWEISHDSLFLEGT